MKQGVRVMVVQPLGRREDHVPDKAGTRSLGCDTGSRRYFYQREVQRL